MTRFNTFSFVSLMLLQAGAQLALTHAGLAPQEACLGVCAILSAASFGSSSVRAFYRRALGPIPALMRL